MTIGSPSGSGATQNDIANGADESDSRWLSYYKDGLTGSQADALTVAGSGATPSFEQYGARFISTSNGDHGRITTGSLFPGQKPTNKVGSILIKTRWGSDVGIGSLTARIISGLAKSGDNPSENDNIACFRPHIGDSTTGNVRVDADGSDSDAAISFPDLTEMHRYAVLIDFEGNYLSPNTTGFYIDSDPRRSETANATISAVPNVFGADQPFGLFYAQDGDIQYLIADHMEVSIRQ